MNRFGLSLSLLSMNLNVLNGAWCGKEKLEIDLVSERQKNRGCQ